MKYVKQVWNYILGCTFSRLFSAIDMIAFCILYTIKPAFWIGFPIWFAWCLISEKIYTWYVKRSTPPVQTASTEFQRSYDNAMKGIHDD